MQEDMKKLIAYSSVAHMGFVTLGIFTLQQQGIATSESVCSANSQYALKRFQHIANFLKDALLSLNFFKLSKCFRNAPRRPPRGQRTATIRPERFLVPLLTLDLGSSRGLLPGRSWLLPGLFWSSRGPSCRVWRVWAPCSGALLRLLGHFGRFVKGSCKLKAAFKLIYILRPW